MSSRGVRTAEECYKMDARGDRQPDVALTAVMTGNDQKPYGVGVAEQGVPGYSPFYKGDLWFKSYIEAQKYAKNYNEKMGLTEKEAMMIVLSSMRADGIQNTYRQGVQRPPKRGTPITQTFELTKENLVFDTKTITSTSKTDLRNQIREWRRSFGTERDTWAVPIVPEGDWPYWEGD